MPHTYITALALLLLLGATPGFAAEPPTLPPKQCLLVPGRSPESNATWEAFLGQAAHRIIAYMYGINHPGHEVFYNRETISTILSRIRNADSALLRPSEEKLCPDITDIREHCVFEIKPRSEQRVQEGRRQVKVYLDALNRATPPARPFTPGTDSQGETLIRFAQGEYIWRLQWETREPGLIVYHWTRSKERFESETKAYESAEWVELTEQELKQYGGWVGQAVEGMVDRRQRLASFSGVVGVVIEIAGNVAVGYFSAATFGRMGSRPGAQKPPLGQPAGKGAKLNSLPQQAPPAAPPRAASGM